MSPERRTASRFGTAARRGMWAKGGMLAPLVQMPCQATFALF